MAATLLSLGTSVIAFSAVSGCSSSSLSPAASTPPAPPVAQGSPPAPASRVKTLGDGTSVSLYGSSGGDDGGVDVSLVVKAGGTGLDLRNASAVQIAPVDEAGNDPWSQAEQPTYNGLYSVPDLQPGQSACIQQTFRTDDQPEPYADLHGFTVTVTKPNGTLESTTLTLVDIDTDINCP
jgi:hypothetical protein